MENKTPLTADISQLRNDYSSQQLETRMVNADPLVQFGAWLQQAIDCQLKEPTAMFLATCHHNKPSGRVVLLKGVDHGFTFYTNFLSRKGLELLENPQASLTFWWDVLERQVRIEGRVEKVERAEAQAYFASRPRGSQIGAHASAQSQMIKNREELEQQVARLTAEFEGREVPLPDEWGGFRLIPSYMEFWQGRPSRLHDRVCYRLHHGTEWEIFRLAP